MLTEGAAKKKLGGVKHTADAVPVMFFGTLEVGWIGQADVVCFKDGMQKDFLVKGKHKSFVRACGQVWGGLASSPSACTLSRPTLCFLHCCTPTRHAAVRATPPSPASAS